MPLTVTINYTYKAEVIHRRCPSKTKSILGMGFARMGLMINHHRLLAPIGYISPAEAEENYDQQLARDFVVEI